MLVNRAVGAADQQWNVCRERLDAAIASRRPELWESNPRTAERIEMRIKDAQRAQRQAHGSSKQAARCLAERHPDLAAARRVAACSRASAPAWRARASPSASD